MAASEPTTSEPTTTRAPEEKTFRAYNAAEGKNYAKTRADYHSSVYETVLSQHASSGGAHDLLMDVGCGPGGPTRVLAAHFAHAIGLDASQGMITTAQSLGGATKSGAAIRWEVNGADDLGASRGVASGTVDLIMAANAAHWFDMSAFWHAAARQLKPGGTVALWTSGDIRVHPSMPEAEKLSDALDVLEKEELRAFMEPGNVLAKNGYRDLPLPWSLDNPIEAFDEESFFRRDWDVHEEFFAIGEIDLPTVEKMMGTGSHISRWRAAHPDIKPGTDQDIARRIRRTIEDHLRATGVPEDEMRMKGAVKGVMLIVKKKEQ